MAQSYCNLIYHLVFATKRRENRLHESVRPRLHEYLGGAIRGEGGVALIVGGTADHVHLLAKLRQDKTVADILRDVKSNSSAWIHRTCPDGTEFAWQAGYGAFTVSASQIEKVRQYISTQEQHHRAMSFEDEFVALLRAHGVEYDERYIWD